MNYKITFDLKIDDYEREYARQEEIHIGASPDMLRKCAVWSLLCLPEIGVLSDAKLTIKEEGLYSASLVFTDYDPCFEPIFLKSVRMYCEARNLPDPVPGGDEKQDENE